MCVGLLAECVLLGCSCAGEMIECTSWEGLCGKESSAVLVWLGCACYVRCISWTHGLWLVTGGTVLFSWPQQEEDDVAYCPWKVQ